MLFDNALSEQTFSRELALGEAWLEEGKGYVLWRKTEGMADILRLGVHPDAQGQGVGRRLLERALDSANHAVLTVRKSNARALRMYQAAGFFITGHLQADESWVMQWDRGVTSPAS